jgi:uncharacterized DUF497 family protein
MSLQFEWDEDKNEKHGLDFEDASEVFDGPMLVALDSRQDYGEDRWIGLGLLEHRVVVVVYTLRGPQLVRVISMRKALQHERFHFEEFLHNRLGTD